VFSIFSSFYRQEPIYICQNFKKAVKKIKNKQVLKILYRLCEGEKVELIKYPYFELKIEGDCLIFSYCVLFFRGKKLFCDTGEDLIEFSTIGEALKFIKVLLKQQQGKN
jgi:hypothetical protein